MLGCSQEKKDRDIKADITTKAKSEVAFAGLSYTVDEGIVHVTGQCPGLKQKTEALTTIRGIAGVKGVVDSISIAPVMLDDRFSLKRSVDSVLKKQNLITAMLEGDRLVLYGQVNEDEWPALMEGLQSLPLSGIDNRMHIEASP